MRYIERRPEYNAIQLVMDNIESVAEIIPGCKWFSKDLGGKTVRFARTHDQHELLNVVEVACGDWVVVTPEGDVRVMAPREFSGRFERVATCKLDVGTGAAAFSGTLNNPTRQ